MTSDEERAEVLANVHDDAESEDNQASDIPQLPPAEGSETFTFTSSGEFLLLRWLLRGLSLWHPRSSCCFSRYFYPGLIALLFALIAIWTLVRLFLEGDYTLNVSLWTKLFFIVLFVSACFSHHAGCVYFRSRDFENNMISITLDDAGQLGEFRKKIKYYNVRIGISLLVALSWLGYNFYYRSSYQSPVMNSLVFFANAYFTGIYLSVLWVIDTLQLVSNTRLRKQHRKFLKWTQGAEAAINDHISNYTTKVETSCRRLRFWFFIHNVSLTILIPIIVLSNLVGGASLKLGTVAYIAVYILIWAFPLYFAEQIGKNDERFCCEVNNFCPEQLTGQNEERYQLTFVSRSEVQLLVAYLKNIRSGFLAVGYTFQLKLSIVAAVFSLGALLFKTNF